MFQHIIKEHKARWNKILKLPTGEREDAIAHKIVEIRVHGIVETIQKSINREAGLPPRTKLTKEAQAQNKQKRMDKKERRGPVTQKKRKQTMITDFRDYRL